MLFNFLLIIKFLFFIQITRFVNCVELFSTDPDIDRNASQMISSRGFVPQEHNVLTSDGYILTIVRIINPFRRNGPNLYPVCFQYGIAGNPEQFLVTEPGSLAPNGSYIEDNGIVTNCSSIDSVGRSLPFVLSACGYDVWLGNYRGSSYSSHILLNQYKDSRYWNFNFDHYSTFDLPAYIQYILRETGSETIGFIGYSLGNAIMFQMLSTQLQYSSIIKPFISLGTFVHIGHIRSPLVRLAQLLEPLLRLFSVRIGGLGRYQPLFGRYFCGNSFLKEICVLVYGLIGGFDIQNINKAFIPRLYAHFPDGLSSIAVAHLGQRINNNRFSYYDYGVPGNLQVYGQEGALDYNLSKINSNYLVLMSGTNDWLSDGPDIDQLRRELTVRPLADYTVSYPYWTHGDFLYGNSVGKYINSAILRIFQSLNLN